MNTKALWTVLTVVAGVIVATIVMKKFPQISGGNNFEGEWDVE